MIATTLDIRPLDFTLPPELQASEPPEARGLSRDDVRLMVSHYETDRTDHARFREIGDYLQAGDVLVINTSGTLNAAIQATNPNGYHYKIHLSTRLPADLWVVEVRELAANTTQPFYDACPGEVYTLEDGGTITLLAPHSAALRDDTNRVRLWIATLDLPVSVNAYLTEYGFPIRYHYVRESWPIDFYQTVYANSPGSAEMPSAGRAFTPEILTRLSAKGVQIAPLILHTGVASLEDHEPPYEEVYDVPAQTARIVTQARRDGRRVIAVGTTVIRALETVTGDDGITHPGSGWTDLVITPERGIRSADGLLTGLHEPKATHLAMLEALTGRDHLRHTYMQALERSYLWHEFGDLHLILP